MNQLKVKYRTPEVAIYKIISAKKRNIYRYLITTSETRKICNKPEIIGLEFKKMLSQGIMKVLGKMDGEFGFSRQKDKDVCVLHFLRGGLTFGLYESLGAAYGFNRHQCSFITSQRYRRGLNWHIKYDQYRKLSLPEKDVTFFLADVVATGTTLENGLEILVNLCRGMKKNIRNFVLFTIGGDRAEIILEKYDKIFRKNFKYGNTWLFYIEGIFTMPEKGTKLTAAIPGTDLVRRPALLAPEFELSQYENYYYPLERCAIYDISSRVFEYKTHLIDTIEYWEKLKESGKTLRELYRERWPVEIAVSSQEIQFINWLTKNRNNKKFISDRILQLEKLL
ncbi:MAG: phosphoribosyltransferase [Elusimicrobiota bacterium]